MARKKADPKPSKVELTVRVDPELKARIDSKIANGKFNDWAVHMFENVTSDPLDALDRDHQVTAHAETQSIPVASVTPSQPMPACIETQPVSATPAALPQVEIQHVLVTQGPPRLRPPVEALVFGMSADGWRALPEQEQNMRVRKILRGQNLCSDDEAVRDAKTMTDEYFARYLGYDESCRRLSSENM